MVSGKLCLVTGAASGLGKAVCELFLNSGAKVIAVDINENVLNTSMQEIVQKYPGIVRDSLFTEQTEQQFDDVIDVNLKGTYLVSQKFSKLLVNLFKERQGSGIPPGGGSIINIASIVGKTGNIGQANYAASKAGVQGLTKTIAIELARYNIRCNAILPGFITTPMTDSVPEKLAEHTKRLIPLRRFGTPQEVAELCLFLASDKSSYITGASIDITGGLGMAN